MQDIMQDIQKILCESELEEISHFPLQRSQDCEEWEDIPREEMGRILETFPQEKALNFLEVLRTGSNPRLGDYYYRIRPRNPLYL